MSFRWRSAVSDARRHHVPPEVPAAMSHVTASPTADESAEPDPQTDAEPVDDNGRRIDRRRNVVDRWGIDRRRPWAALSV